MSNTAPTAEAIQALALGEDTLSRLLEAADVLTQGRAFAERLDAAPQPLTDDEANMLARVAATNTTNASNAAWIGRHGIDAGVTSADASALATALTRAGARMRGGASTAETIMVVLGHDLCALFRCRGVARKLAEGRTFIGDVEERRGSQKPWPDDETGDAVLEAYDRIAATNARDAALLRHHGIDPGATANDARNLVLELTAAVEKSGE